MGGTVVGGCNYGKVVPLVAVVMLMSLVAVFFVPYCLWWR